MSALGDALALAGWIIAFDGGLVTDPRPLYRSCSIDTLGAIFDTISARSGIRWLVVAEVLWRDGKADDWTFECTGIRGGRLTYHVRDEAAQTMRAIYMGAA